MGLLVILANWNPSCMLSAYAQQSKPNEYAVKAAYLYNFGKFVDWSATSSPAKDDSFVICILGQDPFGSSLETTLANQTVNGKTVVARRISKSDEALNCRMYLSARQRTGDSETSCPRSIKPEF